MINQQTQSPSSEKEKPRHVLHTLPHIDIVIPAKDDQGSANDFQTNSDLLVSILPLESARIMTVGEKKKRVSSEVKFIRAIPEVGSTTSLGSSSVKKIKNVIYRPKVDRVISQEKSRLTALEETMMFERQRRFNKLDTIKQLQSMPSPFGGRNPENKKFKRTDEKKAEKDKKFKRVNERPPKPNEEQKMIQARLIKKLREQLFAGNISRIPEQWSEQVESELVEPSPSQEKVFSQSLKESVFQVSEGNQELASFEQKGPQGFGGYGKGQIR